jgi:hypothetical protein
MFLCKNGKNLISRSLNNNNSMGCVFGFWPIAGGQLHQKGALTIFSKSLRLLPSTAERVGLNKILPVRSKLSDQPAGQPDRAARPEKTDGSARGSWGLGPRKR